MRDGSSLDAVELPLLSAGVQYKRPVGRRTRSRALAGPSWHGHTSVGASLRPARCTVNSAHMSRCELVRVFVVFGLCAPCASAL